MRFGVNVEGCLKAIDLGFERAPAPDAAVYKAALRTLELARNHLCRDRLSRLGAVFFKKPCVAHVHDRTSAFAVRHKHLLHRGLSKAVASA